MPTDEEDDDELDEEEGDEDEDEESDDEEDDDDDDGVEAADPEDIVDDVADAITQNMSDVVEVDIEDRAVIMTMSDDTRWKLTLTRI